MATLGTIREFDVEQGDWLHILSRLDYIWKVMILKKSRSVQYCRVGVGPDRDIGSEHVGRLGPVWGPT